MKQEWRDPLGEGKSEQGMEALSSEGREKALNTRGCHWCLLQPGQTVDIDQGLWALLPPSSWELLTEGMR